MPEEGDLNPREFDEKFLRELGIQPWRIRPRKDSAAHLAIKRLAAFSGHRLVAEIDRLGLDWEWGEFDVSADMTEVRGTIVFAGVTLPFRAPLKFGRPTARRAVASA